MNINKYHLCFVISIVFILTACQSQMIETKLESETIDIFLLPYEIEAFETQLTQTITNSTNTIHCALRSLNYPKIEQLFIDAEESGTTVRIFVDNDYIGNHRVRLPFVQFSESKEWGMMHNNFCIFDDQIVMTGSTIFNQNTYNITQHDSIFINSQELAQAYTSEFWKLYTHQNKTSSQATNRERLENTSYEVLFCPQDDCIERYVALVNSANKTVRFGSYALTHPEVISAFQSARNRGVIVYGFIDFAGITSNSIANRNIPGVQTFKSGYFLHTKLLVIDSKIALTGSLNPSLTAQNANDENILIIREENVAEFYEAFILFQRKINRYYN